MKKLQLFSDQAIGETPESREDGFDFTTYADAISNVILGTQGPFTIGVFGEWGSGKTSLLHMIQNKIKNRDDNILPIWFNAWQYEKDDHPIIPLIATIILELKNNQTFLEKLGNGGKEVINLLRSIAYGFSFNAKISIPAIGEIGAGLIAKEMIERDEKLHSDPLLEKSLYFNAFSRISEINLNNRKILIIIDDLDRCFPDSAIKLLESIKLVLSQKGFIFIIGVSAKVIEGYLSHKYRSEYGIEDFKGNSYLDKIVQLPFHLPNQSNRVDSFVNLLFSKIPDLPESEKHELEKVLPLIGLVTKGNPRGIIRLINNLLLLRSIMLSLKTSHKLKVFSLPVCAFSLCLQMNNPEKYLWLVQNPEFCNAIFKINDEEFLKNLSEEKNKMLELLNEIRKDEDLYKILTSEIAKTWLTDDELRSSTTQFLSTVIKNVEKKSSQTYVYLDIYCYSTTSSSVQQFRNEINKILAEDCMINLIPLEALLIGREITFGDNITRILIINKEFIDLVSIILQNNLAQFNQNNLIILLSDVPNEYINEYKKFGKTIKIGSSLKKEIPLIISILLPIIRNLHDK